MEKQVTPFPASVNFISWTVRLWSHIIPVLLSERKDRGCSSTNLRREDNDIYGVGGQLLYYNGNCDPPPHK